MKKEKQSEKLEIIPEYIQKIVDSQEKGYIVNYSRNVGKTWAARIIASKNANEKKG